MSTRRAYVGGCHHGFSWSSLSTAATEPPEWTVATCPLCGTLAHWRDGAWRVSTESTGSIAMAELEWTNHALNIAMHALRRLASHTGDEFCREARRVAGPAVEAVDKIVRGETPGGQSDATGPKR